MKVVDSVADAEHYWHPHPFVTRSDLRPSPRAVSGPIKARKETGVFGIRGSVDGGES